MKSLAGEDAFFLYAETPEQHQHTLGLVVLDPSTATNPKNVTVEALAEKFNRDIEAIPAFRQKLSSVPISLAPPALVDDSTFRFEDHVEFITLRSRDPARELSALLGDFASIPLDKSKPLWRAMFISGLPDNKLAICTKSHHLISDGVQGAEFMSRQFDLSPKVRRTSADQRAAWDPKFLSRFDIFKTSWSHYYTRRPKLTSLLGKTVKSFVDRRDFLRERDPGHDLIPAMVGGAPRCKFNGEITGNRVIALGSLPMPLLKQLKDHFGVTFNDVVLALCALSLRDYLLRTHDLPEQDLVCFVPVSLRAEGVTTESGNAVGNMPVKLPIHEQDPETCLRTVHRYSIAAKELFNSSFSNLIVNYVSTLPPNIANAALKVIFSNTLAKLAAPQANLVISNIAGPRVPLFMSGAKLAATYPIGPIITGSGLNITFMSQEGAMNFSVQACREKLPEAWQLVEGILNAADALHNAMKGNMNQLPSAKTRKASTRKSAAKERPSHKMSTPKSRKVKPKLPSGTRRTPSSTQQPPKRRPRRTKVSH